MRRTDELKASGTATDRTGGGGGGAPFIKWPKDAKYAWVEGRLRKIWTGKFGDSATLEVTAISNGLMAKGRDDDGEEVVSSPHASDTVNVGLNSSALQDTLSQEDVGTNVHIAFEGWEESKSGNRYRLFTVLLMDEREELETVPSSDPTEPWPDEGPGEDIPF